MGRDRRNVLLCSKGEVILMDKTRQGDIIQLIGLVVVGVGLGVEIALRAHFGLIVITVGSVCFAVGTKLKGR